MKEHPTRRRRANGLKVAFVIATIVTTAYAYASGPPSARTGAPGEANCTQCHLGTLNSGAGSVTIEGVPTNYEPGQSVTLTVRVQHPDRSRWGFQLTALDSSSAAAGTFEIIDPTVTKLVNGTGTAAGRTYVEHTSTGTKAGQTGGGSWEVRWTAPSSDIGLITFYCAANAANNNNASSGDSIYTTSVTTGMATPTVIAPAYKKGKILLQANGSNILDGASLEVSGGGLTGTETLPLSMNAKGTKWVVKKSAASTPSGLTVDQVLPAGTTVTLVVRNPDGSVSAPVQLSR